MNLIQAVQELTDNPNATHITFKGTGGMDRSLFLVEGVLGFVFKSKHFKPAQIRVSLLERTDFTVWYEPKPEPKRTPGRKARELTTPEIKNLVGLLLDELAGRTSK